MARTVPSRPATHAIAVAVVLLLAGCAGSGSSGSTSSPSGPSSSPGNPSPSPTGPSPSPVASSPAPSTPAASEQVPASATPPTDEAPGILPTRLVGSASVDYDQGDPGLDAWSPDRCLFLSTGAPPGMCDWIVSLRATDVVWQFDRTGAPANPDIGVYRLTGGTLQWSVSGIGQTPDNAECDFNGSGTESLVVDEPGASETGELTLAPVAAENSPMMYFGESTVAIHGQITGCGGAIDDPNLTIMCFDLGQGPSAQVPGSCGQWFDGHGTPVLSEGAWLLEELYPIEPPSIHSSWSFIGTD